MADSLSCGLTARIRVGLGYDDVVDHNSAWYTAGDTSGTVLGMAIPTPCGKAGFIKYAVKGLHAVQGAGSAINAAEAYQQGDTLGMVLNGAGAMFAFGNFGKACFAAGTPIRTPDGFKPIEQLQAGDLVLTRDERYADSKSVTRPVLQTFSNTTQVLRLIVGRDEIRTSPEHPFYVRNHGWRPARLIQPGDQLLTERGEWTKCQAAVLTADIGTVYNVEVAEHHTYFVGARADGSAVWAHNDCTPYGKLRRELSGSGKQAHHLIEKRFAKLFGQKSSQMLAIPLSPAEHQAFTNLWRNAVPYGEGTKRALRGSRAQIEAVARRIYADFPELLEALGL